MRFEADLPSLVDDPHAAAGDLFERSRSRRSSGLERPAQRRLKRSFAARASDRSLGRKESRCPLRSLAGAGNEGKAPPVRRPEARHCTADIASGFSHGRIPRAEYGLPPLTEANRRTVTRFPKRL